MTYTLTYDLTDVAPDAEEEITAAALRLAPSGARLTTALIGDDTGQISYEVAGAYGELDDGELTDFLDARCTVDKNDDAED